LLWPLVAVEVVEEAITATVAAIKEIRAMLAQPMAATVPAWADQMAVVVEVVAVDRTEEQVVLWILALTMGAMLAKAAFV
jgi:hypothetical protein